VSKLLLAIVHNLDAEHVVEAMEEQDHRVTVIPTMGGFLRADNSTLLIAAEDEAVPEILEIIKTHCSSRDVEPPLVVVGRLKDALPRIVRHGGATVLIGDLDAIVKI